MTSYAHISPCSRFSSFPFWNQHIIEKSKDVCQGFELKVRLSPISDGSNMWLRMIPYFIPKIYLILFTGIWVLNQTSFSVFSVSYCQSPFELLFLVSELQYNWQIDLWMEFLAAQCFLTEERHVRLQQQAKVVDSKNQRILNSREIFSGSVAYKNPLFPLDYF